ncbi:MAG: demethylmenaquinone methyltransferase / 2-methoxy-6-polyprenyl,4-benzoquinol methylase [Gaiellales bacterium]|nr:demethylmenaquinone methyltransferase / 2-methoxy-6-polyprenyl,4-benzoquinol methylase [Gaiellales bacterium]
MTGEGPRAGTLEEPQVRAMFDRIASFYDVMNSVMTAGLHHRWRARAADLARVGPGGRVLDVATGTGDLAVELTRRVGAQGEVVGTDFSEEMLARARQKAAAGGLDIAFEWGNALELPYASDRFDAATVGFGARNFSDLDRGLAEMTRVVRPGGRVVVLEITTPTRPPLSSFYALWFDRLVPLLGRAAQAAAGVLAGLRAGSHATNGNGHGPGKIAAAYTYLPNSVKRFPEPAALAAELDRAGLQEISYVLLAGGIVAIHAGTVPAGTIAGGGDR